MAIKVALAIVFLVVFIYIAFWYKDTTEESVRSAGDYVERGIRATEHSREMIKGSKDLVKEREKMADFEDQ